MRGEEQRRLPGAGATYSSFSGGYSIRRYLQYIKTFSLLYLVLYFTILIYKYISNI